MVGPSEGIVVPLGRIDLGDDNRGIVHESDILIDVAVRAPSHVVRDLRPVSDEIAEGRAAEPEHALLPVDAEVFRLDLLERHAGIALECRLPVREDDGRAHIQGSALRHDSGAHHLEPQLAGEVVVDRRRGRPLPRHLLRVAVPVPREVRHGQVAAVGEEAGARVADPGIRDGVGEEVHAVRGNSCCSHAALACSRAPSDVTRIRTGTVGASARAISTCKPWCARVVRDHPSQTASCGAHSGGKVNRAGAEVSW